MIYLDYNATTPLDERVLAEMMPYLTQKFGNAGSNTHTWGWEAAEAVKMARTQVADAIHADESEIVFTSGATEAINLAIKGVAEMYESMGNHIITCKTEHKAVLDTCAYLSEKGFEMSYLSVDEKGRINLDELQNALTDKTILVCIMLANNETGVIQPIKEIAEIVHQTQAIMMSDCVQAVGKIAVNVQELGIDLMPISAHKFYGPKGVGALYVRRRNPRVRLIPQIHGGGQENNRRSGTLNIAGIVGLGKAIEIAEKEREADGIRLKTLRDKLENKLISNKAILVNGAQHSRLPHVSNLTFPGISAEKLIMKLPTFAMATGSACTSALQSPSHVLSAMGLSEKDAYSAIRISLGRFTTAEEVEKVIEGLLKNI